MFKMMGGGDLRRKINSKFRTYFNIYTKKQYLSNDCIHSIRTYIFSISIYYCVSSAGGFSCDAASTVTGGTTAASFCTGILSSVLLGSSPCLPSAGGEDAKSTM